MDMSVNIAGVEWKNPVTVASGTFGSGAEFADYVDINKLGAVTTKGVANVPWAGNPTPRVAEVYGGMMNAIGLQNPGIDLFCERDIPFLKQYDTKIIVNVCGHAPEEYLAVVERLADQPIDMMEINISCPNVNAGFLAFGQDAHHVEELTAQIKKIAKQPVIMKLTPNVTDITEIAKGAEAGGAAAAEAEASCGCASDGSCAVADGVFNETSSGFSSSCFFFLPEKIANNKMSSAIRNAHTASRMICSVVIARKPNVIFFPPVSISYYYSTPIPSLVNPCAEFFMKECAFQYVCNKILPVGYARRGIFFLDRFLP